MLWHYTCAHGFRGIGRRGMIRPNRHPLLPGRPRLIWLTHDDSGPVSRSRLGLTSNFLSCDRMEYRYSICDEDAILFLDYARRMRWAESDWANELLVGDADPSLWWVLDHSTLGLLDRSYGKAAA